MASFPMSGRPSHGVMCPCQTDRDWVRASHKWVEPVTQWVDDLITGWTGIGGSNSGGARADETTGSLLVSSNGSAKTASPHRTITSPLPHNQLRATEENERRNPSAGAKISPTVTLRAIAALNEQILSLPQPESIIFADLDQEGASEFLPGACAQSDCGTASSHEPGERGMERDICVSAGGAARRLGPRERIGGKRPVQLGGFTFIRG